MTEGNPWVDGAAPTGVRNRPAMDGEDWREWLPSSPASPQVPPANDLDEPVELDKPTGPVEPQPHVPLPEDALPVGDDDDVHRTAAPVAQHFS